MQTDNRNMEDKCPAPPWNGIARAILLAAERRFKLLLYVFKIWCITLLNHETA